MLSKRLDQLIIEGSESIPDLRASNVYKPAIQCRTDTLTIISGIQESGRKVTLVWFPAHVGIPGNEKADALAKAATTREQIDRWIPASIKDVKRAVGHNIIQQWQTRWVSDPRTQHHKTIEKLVSTKSKFQCASRRKEILISKLRIGKMCSESTPVSLEASSRRKMPGMPSGG